MSDTKKVLRKLLSDHQGDANSITQSQLSEAVGVNTSTLRSEIRRLREERNIPIANKRNGYYVIQSKDELQDFVGHKNQEIQSKRQTIEDTLEAWADYEPDEIEIEPESNTVEAGYDCSKCGGSVPKDSVRYARAGEYEDQPLCKNCYGGLVMNGEA